MIVEPHKSLPAAVARRLRQEAGFGCCKCGSPILQYHHIVEWADEEHFRPEDMMVLCPLHHDQATKGAMPELEQRQMKSAPHNIQRGHALGLLEVKQDYCAADLGSVTVVGEGSFIRVDNDDILSLHMGPQNLEISLKLYSETDALLIEIVRNEWISGDPLPWDIEADWQTLTLRERNRKISIFVNAKTVPMQLRGEFWRSGKAIVVDKNGHVVRGQSALGLRNPALVGGGLELNTTAVTIGQSDGVIISWHNPRERLWKARDAWRKMSAKKKSENA